jgi:hypothetical protein
MTSQDSAAGSRKSALFWNGSIVAATVIFLWANLFTFAGRPILLGGDQVFFWMDAARMLRGERIYLDFFQFTPPGADLVFLGVFRAFGARLWVTNAVVLLLGVGLTWLCFRVSLRLASPSAAALAAMLFLVLVYAKLLGATHHWFSIFAVIAAVAVLMAGESSPRIVLAGGLLGVASFFTQTRGAAAALGIACYFAWTALVARDSWFSLLKRTALLLVSFVAVWAALSAYFIAQSGLHTLLYFQITYVRRFMVTGWKSAGFPKPFTLRNIPSLSQYVFVYAMLPVVYATSLWRCFRSAGEPAAGPRRHQALLTLVGFALALEVAQSPNWVRVFCVALPGVILLIVKLTDAVPRSRILVCAIWIAIAALALVRTRAIYRATPELVRLPAGVAAAPHATAEKFRWLADRTQPNDEFFQAAFPGVYVPLALSNPVYLDVLETDDQTRPEYIERSIAQLEAKNVRFILWSPRLDVPDQLHGASAYHLAPFRDFLARRYGLVHVFSDGDQLWQLNSSSPGSFELRPVASE